MARKKQATYGDMARAIERMQADMKKEKERMAGVMATALLKDEIMDKLGDCSDADLRRIMSLLSGYVDDCLARLEMEKQPQNVDK